MVRADNRTYAFRFGEVRGSLAAKRQGSKFRVMSGYGMAGSLCHIWVKPDRTPHKDVRGVYEKLRGRPIERYSRPLLRHDRDGSMLGFSTRQRRHDVAFGQIYQAVHGPACAVGIASPDLVEDRAVIGQALTRRAGV